MQRTQTRRNPRKGISDQGATEFAAEPLERAEAAHVARNSALSATPARLLRLDQGLYAVEIGETTAPDGEISGLMLPVIQISAPPGDRDEPVEIISTSNGGVSWLAQDGGTVIVRSPSGGGHLLVAAYGPPEQVPDLPRVEVRRLDRSRPHDAALGSMDFCRERGEVQTEIVLHVERLGDRRFPGRRLGRQSRQETAHRSLQHPTARHFAGARHRIQGSWARTGGRRLGSPMQSSAGRADRGCR